MTGTRITATDLARNLSDVLNRARYRGERFIVQRNGEDVAEIGPVAPMKTITLTEFVARVGDLKWPDEDFGRDLERIQAEQPKAELPDWPD
jgi:prevent-host-death family protein